MNSYVTASKRERPADALRIRFAVADDLPGLLAIHNWAIANTSACFTAEPETLASWQACWNEKCPSHPWLIADTGGAIAGYALTHAVLGRCGLPATVETSVYVAAEYQRRGVATVLYHRLLALLKAQGYASLVAVISLPNPASERLHEAFGFRRTGTLARVGWKFGRWHDVGYWQLTLIEPSGAPSRILTAAEAEASLENRDSEIRPGERCSCDCMRTERKSDDR